MKGADNLKRIIPILILILVLSIAGISGCTSPDTNSDSGGDYSSDNITHPEAKNVVVLDSNANKDPGYYIINGTVKNKNSFGVSFIKIGVTCYDKDGNIVTTDWTYADDNDVPSKGKSEFSLYIDDPDNKIVKYDIKVLDADKSLYTAPADDSPTTSTSTSKTDSSSSSSTDSSRSSSESSGTYIGNANTYVFHYSWCHYVNMMKDSNKVYFNTRQEAINAGYRPCKVCNP